MLIMNSLSPVLSCVLLLHLARHSSHSMLLHSHCVLKVSSSVSLQGTNLNTTDAGINTTVQAVPHIHNTQEDSNQESSYCSCVSQGRKPSA